MTTTIHDAIRNMVEESGKPLKVLAEEVGRTYPTLMRELNSEDKGAKLGVEMLLPLMKACRSVLPLRFLATRMGHRLASLQDIDVEEASLHEAMLTTYPALAAFHQAILEGQPLERVAEMREGVIRQVQQDFVAYSAKFDVAKLP